MKILILVLLTSFLSACFLPAGQLKTNDFTWSSKTFPISKEKLYENIAEGFRRCDPYTEKANIGVKDCLHKTNGVILCDIYGGGAYGGRGSLVLGRIKLTGDKNKSTINAGVIHMFDDVIGGDKGATREAWITFAKEDYTICEQVVNENPTGDDFD